MRPTQAEAADLAQTANALSERLEAGLRRIEQTNPSKPLLKGVKMLSLPYAIFLTELCDDTSELTFEQAREKLKLVEAHCDLVDADYPAVAA
ncbi:hypothetical protein [Pseudomonas sp. UMAB-40]|uniref:hypothetical protein n=1 Tax=Pseudomonas sp. UMAB-40 TaxID=1365407 RepID=UPI001C595F15|nr:hypothetical protein [Pseudomonas sp. UMAB-40]